MSDAERLQSWAEGYQRLHAGHRRLLDHLDSVRAWIEGRIAQCIIDERKFGASTPAIDAAREPMVLQTILEKLEVPMEAPHE